MSLRFTILMLVCAAAIPLTGDRAYAQEVKVTAAPPAPAAEPALPKHLEPEKTPYVWVDAEIGVSAMNMPLYAFAYGGWQTTLVNLRADGLGLLGALGGRYRWFIAGARVSHSRYENFDINTAGGEFGIQLQGVWIEPRMQLHVAYAWNSQTNHPDLPETDVRGLAFGGGAGFRVHLTRFLDLGLSYDGEGLSMVGKTVLVRNAPGVDPQTQDRYIRALAQGRLPTELRRRGWQMRTSLSVTLRF